MGPPAGCGLTADEEEMGPALRHTAESECTSCGCEESLLGTRAGPPIPPPPPTGAPSPCCCREARSSSSAEVRFTGGAKARAMSASSGACSAVDRWGVAAFGPPLAAAGEGTDELLAL